MFIHFLKNAEMTINFGSSPWRFKPVEDYIGFSAAPAKYVSENKNREVVQERKMVANAPQAIIIEVTIVLLKFVVLSC
jgi:hypothetical protein